MKTIIILLFTAATVLFTAPYFVGLENERNVNIVCQKFTERTDSDIDTDLSVYNFDIDCFTVPTFADYYKSGFKTLFN